MARVFISSNNCDYALGEQLEAALKRRGHKMTVGVAEEHVGRWEKALLSALRAADVFIPFLSEHGISSQWVVSQTGQAVAYEYTRGMLVLPVLPKGASVPHFVSSFQCYWLKGNASEHVDELAARLHSAINAHIKNRPPRVFISHRHHDADVAEAIIQLLGAAFQIQKRDIRCTSVAGYKLAAGDKSADSLLHDLNGAELVIGLIGPDTTESDYVLFELGGSWGLGVPTFPLRIHNATYDNVPEVLRERSSLDLTDLSQCMQLVEDVGRVSSLVRRAPRVRTVQIVAECAKSLARVSAASGPGRVTKKPVERTRPAPRPSR